MKSVGSTGQRSPQSAELLLRFEIELAFSVNLKKEKRQLVEKADFTL